MRCAAVSYPLPRLTCRDYRRVFTKRAVFLVGERCLQNHLGLLHGGERLGRLFDRERNARQTPEGNAPGDDKLDDASPQKRHRPGRVDVSDLRRADLDAVVMDLVTEEKSRRLALVKPNGYDASAAAYRPDGLMQRPRRAGALENNSDVFGAEAELELMRNI